MRLKGLATAGMAVGLTVLMVVISSVGMMGGASSGGSAAAQVASRKRCSKTSATSSASDGTMDRVIEEARKMADDDTIGYSQANRRLDPDVDCSSFVFYALKKAGFDVGDSPFNTIGMDTTLPKLGFTKTSWSGDASQLKKGDIMWAGGHTEIYLGDGKTIGAHQDLDGHDGDGSGNEVSAVKLRTSAFTAYYRLESGSSDQTSSGSTVTISDTAGKDISYLDSWEYGDAASHDPGGDKGKCTYGYDQCTQWACIRSHMFGYREVHNVMGNGMDWVDSAVALGWHKGVIAPGSIMSWAPGTQVPSGTGYWTAAAVYGHVSIVESVDTKNKTLQFSESGSGFGHIHTSSMSYANIPNGLTFASPPNITEETSGVALTSDGDSTSDSADTSCDTDDDADAVVDTSYSGDGNHAGPDDAKKIARQLLSQYFPDDHGSDQWEALEKLWTKESSWRWDAENASSGAYGIPQSLPGDKMASAGSDWKDNATTQIKWGLGYIKDRYGTPKAAWSHSQSTGWY